MIARKYLDSDYETFCSWFEARNLTPPGRELLSSTGLICDSAVGFLYLTNSGVGIFDCFVTNPHSSREDRKAALDLISAALISLAQAENVKVLKADSTFESIVQLGERFGFKKTGTYQSFQRKF